MIDTKELRRLAQAATPGPWKTGQYLGSLRQFVINMDVGDKGRGSDVAFTSSAFGSDETVANARLIAAANPAAITELLDRLESAEKERDWNAERLEDAVEELTALRAELETERMRLAACGVVALSNTPDSAKQARDMLPEYWSASCGDVARLVEENIKLRAKVEAMEQQEPVATVRINAINGNPSVDFVPGHHYLHHNDRLYLAPGAQPAPSVPDEIERDVLRACCGTFHGSRHRITCEKYKGKREPGDKP